MMYSVPKSEIQTIADALEEYYQEAWDAGIKSLADRMARSQMGIVNGYIDTAKDTYANLKKKSADSFKVTFKAQLKQQIALNTAIKADVASFLVGAGEKALEKIAERIPVPGLSSILNFAAKKAKDELHERAITKADKLLEAKAGGELQKIFTSDKDAQEFIQNATKQYKTLASYISVMPSNITTFDDAITYPRSAFRVMQAASSLNVSLWRIRNYLDSMSERLVECQRVSKDFIETVRTKMPDAVQDVLLEAYSESYKKGDQDVKAKKYSACTPLPVPQKTGGGATQLANRVAHAVRQGYYDAGNRRL